MYQERKFISWPRGLLHLFIVILLPIIPAIVYLVTDGNKGYFYFLLLTVIITICYEFFNSNTNCSIWLKIENILSAISLSVLLVWDLYMIILSSTQKSFIMKDYYKQTVGFMFLFLIPIFSTLVEIFRAMIAYITIGTITINSEKNLVNGAKNV